VLAMTDEGDAVFDPYAGVASSLIAAVKHGRRAFGVDRTPEYVDIGKKRLSGLINGLLETRPIGRPVYEPKGNERTVQIPIEWKGVDGSVYK
jgi:adenine-specific DNA-methyltransferase